MCRLRDAPSTPATKRSASRLALQCVLIRAPLVSRPLTLFTRESRNIHKPDNVGGLLLTNFGLGFLFLLFFSVSVVVIVFETRSQNVTQTGL